MHVTELYVKNKFTFALLLKAINTYLFMRANIWKDTSQVANCGFLEETKIIIYFLVMDTSSFYFLHFSFISFSTRMHCLPCLSDLTLSFDG